MRGTHIYTSKVDPHDPYWALHFMQNPTQARRNIHLTPTQHYYRLQKLFPQSRIIALWGPTSIQSLPNSLLWFRPPAACEAELTLDRWQRVQLGRVRCGHSTGVLSYMLRLGLAQDDSWVLSQLWTGPSRHCPQTQQHRITHDIHSQEHLCIRPVEESNFLYDLGMVQRPT